MICPNCKQELKLDSRVKYNAENYSNGKFLKAWARCCNKLLKVKALPVFQYTAFVIEGDEDSWGEDINKNSES